MRLIIENVNTNNIDYIDDVLGICGLAQCHESSHMSITTHHVDLEKYPLDKYGEKHFFRMCKEALCYGFAFKLTK